MPVYALSWSRFHENYFLSCAADWLLKLWDIGRPAPLLYIDLGGPVADCMWGVSEPTVIGGLTVAGELVMYDIERSTKEPICRQAVTKSSTSPSCLALSEAELGVVLVGCENGAVGCYKFSRGLRTTGKKRGGDANDYYYQQQQQQQRRDRPPGSEAGGEQKNIEAETTPGQRLDRAIAHLEGSIVKAEA
eukprot:GHVU01034090.1.p1 GENE.GHVU01034090.1~~GHVU01034090.1.p1  ORF type:complete len:190 (-),score=32.46 GHVU01034090.1:144-713(-)